MKKIILSMLIILWVFQVWCQDVHSHQFSSVPETSRYEIVQSEMGVRYTFKIDKYKGEVFQLVKSLDDDLVWESLGLDPIVDLYLEATLELIAELTPEQIAKINEMNLEQFVELTPEQMTKYGIENDQFSAITPDKVNFQLFMSGLGIRYTFLLHVHSGRTWQLKRDLETDNLFWSSND